MSRFADNVQVVWLKRDLRIRDHRPLPEASRRGPTVDEARKVYARHGSRKHPGSRARRVTSAARRTNHA